MRRVEPAREAQLGQVCAQHEGSQQRISLAVNVPSVADEFEGGEERKLRQELCLRHIHDGAEIESCDRRKCEEQVSSAPVSSHRADAQ